MLRRRSVQGKVRDMNYEDLKEKTSAVTARFNDLSEKIKGLEEQMIANSELQKQIVTYAKICIP